jgi:hypothetical protein
MILATVLFLSGLASHPGAMLGHELRAPSTEFAPASALDPAGASLRLRPDRFGELGPDDLSEPMSAQRRPRARSAPPTPPTPVAPPPEAPAVAPSPECPTAATGEACDIDCDTCRESDRMARYVLHRRTSLLRTHRAFAIAAWSTLLVTELFGTIQAVNQDTWFGRGNCASDPGAFGCHQSSLITGLHETMAFVTVGLYTTAAAVAIAAPDPENASEGEGTAPSTLRLHKAMAWVHGIGMILLPILGVASVAPQIFGVSNSESRADFTRAMRSVHAIVGYTTFAALTFSAYLEL